MRKNDLISYLQSIDGNPEVLIWNGFVDDWHRIEPSVVKLTKIDKKYFFESYRLSRCLANEDLSYQLTPEELKKCELNYARHDYSHNELIYQEDIKQKQYKQKKVVMLQGKSRVVSTFDRIGGLFY